VARRAYHTNVAVFV